MTDKQGSKSIMAPLLAGIAGAGLALLLAPRSGRETRGKIQESAHDLQQNAKDAIDTSQQKLNDSREHARSITDKITSAIKTRGRQTEHDIDEIIKSEAKNDHPSYPSEWNENR